MSKPSEPELQALRATLAARSQVLKIETAEFDAARSETLESVRDTVEDAGDEAENRRHDEVRDGEEQRDLNELHAIDSALARIDAGSYGECTDCGIDIPLVPYATFGTEELGRHVADGLSHRNACLMANHGAIAIGATLTAALELAAEVENLAEQYVKVLSLGAPHILSDAEMADVLQRFKAYGQKAQD